MSDTSAGHPDKPGRYEIRIKGHLASRWATWFDGMTLTANSDGTTVLDGPVADQAALHGLLHKVRDIGLPLLSVAQLDTDQPTCPPPNPDDSHPGD
ncbi:MULTISPECIES: hypothetical protein [Micromonospora]|uniref:Uncharacterized protein n=1 Tax=Micromonospora cremea TaxID=709881 RepID=A0A1N5TGA1_9ACTN|nr:hypothetical protein [Micromonospora cremea]WSZ91445.1 hypothetical protein OG990_05030 [Micromonospora sp. NBC_00858]SIM47422.1 hypothetical protein SAMN04489832_0158 [Micromonospora cremea]